MLVFVKPATKAWEPSWIKKADTMPAENFRAEPNVNSSSAAFAQDGINAKKRRAIALTMYLAIFKILFFFMAIAAEQKKKNPHRG